MAIVPQNFPAYLRSLRIILTALLAGQAMVLGVLYIIRLQEMPAPRPDLEQWATTLLPLVLLPFAAASFLLYRKKMGDARAQANLKGKLMAYRVALLLRWAPLEVAILLMGVFYFLTGLIFLWFTAILLALLFATQWPSRAKVVASLDLSTSEQSVLDDPNAVVAEISTRGGRS